MLLLSKYIARHEFEPLSRYFRIEDLLDGADKVLKGLGQKISFDSPDSNFRFYKVRIGRGVKGRMIVFMITGASKVVPVLIGLKKDKKIGMNMSPNNPFVIERIDNNLAHTVKDMEDGNFETFELN